MALGGAAYGVGVQAARILKSNPRPGFIPGRDVEAEGNKTGPRGLPPFAPTTILLKLRVQSGRVLRSKYIFTQGAILPRANQSQEQREKVITKMVHLNSSYASRTAVPRLRQWVIKTEETWQGSGQETLRGPRGGAQKNRLHPTFPPSSTRCAAVLCRSQVSACLSFQVSLSGAKPPPKPVLSVTHPWSLVAPSEAEWSANQTHSKV